MSMGTLPVAVNPGISQNGVEINFTWEISASPASEYHTDRTMLVIYFPDIKETCCQLIGAKRVEGKDVIVISQEHINQRMEAYISFAKDNGKAVSNSVHAGSLNASPKVTVEIKPAEEVKARAVKPAQGPVCENEKDIDVPNSSVTESINGFSGDSPGPG
jgi:hypothetical protein